MVAEKTLRYQGKNQDPAQLGPQIGEKLKSEGYKVQYTSGAAGSVVQATKAGILRDIISADRAFTIVISGQPNDFTIRVGIGKLVQNLAVTAVEVVILSPLFLAVDVPEMLWTTHVEKGIISEIEQVVGMPGSVVAGSMSSQPSGVSTA